MVIKRVTPQQEQMEIQDGDFSLKSPAWLTVKKKKKDSGNVWTGLWIYTYRLAAWGIGYKGRDC